jgi:hypothetical protein
MQESQAGTETDVNRYLGPNQDNAVRAKEQMSRQVGMG